VENVIEGSQTEGIYIVNAGNAWVLRNSVRMNHVGIVI
jgi:hypothetical protein